MSKQYHVTVEPRNDTPAQALELDFTSHEDLHELVERVRGKKMFSEAEATTFVLGLKMFSSVLLAHRNEEPFVDFAPHFGDLMKKLKGSGPAKS